MQEVWSRVRRAPAPWGVVGMLVLVVCVERYTLRHSSQFDHVYGLEWRQTGRAAVKEAPGRAILCFGDSLAKTGVSPVVIEHELGRSTYNLALTGGQLPSSYFLLKLALDAGARPEAILLDCKWTALAHPYHYNRRLIPEVFGPAQFFDLARASGDPSLFASLTASWLLGTSRASHEVRESAIAALRGNERRVGDPLFRLRRNWRINHGAFHPPHEGTFNGKPDYSDHVVFNANWVPDPVNADYLGRFLDLASRHGIPVFLLAMPVSPAVQSRREEIGADERYGEFLRKAVAKFSNVFVIDGRRSEYLASVFVDPTHLDRLGATVFSAEVARIMRPILEGRRAPDDHWVALPRFRPDLPVGVRPEDVLESGVAVDTLMKKRRR